MRTCGFCSIVAGMSPASVVFQDAKIMAFMDIQPVTEGHTLLIPRAHMPSIADVDGATTEHLYRVARRITGAIYEALNCDGVNWFVADKEAAGQDVFHMHLHLIPRYVGDGFGLRHPPDYSVLPARQALDRTAHELSGALERLEGRCGTVACSRARTP